MSSHLPDDTPQWSNAVPGAMPDALLEARAATALRDGDEATAAPLLAEIDARQDAQAARLARPDALAHAALWYAAQGIAVFPLRPRAKLPLLRNPHPRNSRERVECRGECGQQGHGLYDATTSADIVAAWWRQHPGANIGIPTGGRWDVIDVDGPQGFQSLAKLEADGKLPARVAQSRTPGNPSDGRPGGIHYWITATGDGNRAGIMPGLDYRGAGGYVVAPPSHGPGGGQYTWCAGLEIGAAL